MIRRHGWTAGTMAACAWLALSTTTSGQIEAGDVLIRPAVAPVVGDTPPSDQVQLIENVGVFGLGPNLPGSRYAVVAKHLVRIDAQSGQILSILRPLPDRDH